MPKFDDRFARQNRCEPPPEFPLASPYPGIVHLSLSLAAARNHHSGEGVGVMLYVPSFGSDPARSYSNPSEDIRIGRWCAEAPTCVHFHCACGLATHTLAPNLDSLVRVSRRVAGGHYASILAPGGRGPRPARGHCGRGCNTPLGEPRSPPLCPPAAGRCWPGRGGVRRRERRVTRRARVWPRALPFQQFHVLFNPLSKVLFIFRSLYLCAIGLRPVFSFRRGLPPT